MRVHEEEFSMVDTCLINFAMGMQILFILYGFTGNPLYDREMFVPYFVACAISQNYSRLRMSYGGINSESWDCNPL